MKSALQKPPFCYKGEKGYTQLLLIILVLVILLLVGGWWFFNSKRNTAAEQTISTNINQSSDTKSISELVTFTSPTYKYSINYPKDWTILKGEHIEDTDKEKQVSFSNFNDSSWIVIKVLDQKWEEIENSPPWISSPTSTTLAGVSGIEGEESLKDGKPKIAKYIYLKHPTLPGVVVSVRVQGNNDEVLNSVLNTLKFN